MPSADPFEDAPPSPSAPLASESARDRLFVTEGAPSQFRFDDAVARVFPDMLRRSIPGYSTLLDLIGVLSRQTVQSGSTVYDLGCSLGAVSLAIRHALGSRDARIVAIDNSPAMVERCREVISADSGLCPVDVIEGDIASLTLEPASLVVLNFTLQFASLDEREGVLRAIAGKLLPGGALVLSEKTASPEAPLEDFYTQTHDSFRESNGYSRLEISRKREALERFLVPEAPATHVARMRAVGLEPIEWFRCLHFVSWVARKPA